MWKFVFLYLIFNVDAARILAVFPTPSISHQVAFRPLTQELSKRGHEVIVITTDPTFPKGNSPANLTEIDVHDISYKLWRENVLPRTSRQADDLYNQMTVILDLLIELSKLQLQTDEVQNLIKNKTTYFDLLLLEACNKPALGLSHIFKVPVIFISSFGAILGNNELVGAPTNPPLLYPFVMRQRLYNLTLWEKVTELYNHYSMDYLFFDHERKSDMMLRELFGSDIPTLYELGNNVHMIFYNLHPIWDDNRPVPPSVIYMGGIHQKPIKELPQDLKSYLDSSLHGVIYISFGTNVSPSLLPTDKVKKMIKVFSQLPYDVLWKWDKDELPEKSNNIKISKWLPQSDLLRHPKVKLFITQGGLQSTDEAITAGVPLIGMPMLGDQWYNVEKYAHHRIGLRYDMETLTQETFAKAINTILKDDSYRHNVAKLRTLMLDQPQRPLERAVWWTEHVLRHGGARYLRAPAANMSWSEYLDLELVSTLLLIIILFLMMIILTMYLMMNLLKNIFKSNDKVKVS